MNLPSILLRRFTQNMLAMRHTLQWLQELGRLLIRDFAKNIGVQEHRTRTSMVCIIHE